MILVTNAPRTVDSVMRPFFAGVVLIATTTSAGGASVAGVRTADHEAEFLQLGDVPAEDRGADAEAEAEEVGPAKL